MNVIFRKPLFLSLCMTFLLSLLCVFPSLAATRTKITSLKLTIAEDDIAPGMRYGAETLDIDVDALHCGFDYYEIDDDTDLEWPETGTPRITVHLSVDDDDKYYFSSDIKKNLKITGGTYVSGTLTTAESATELYFKVDLTPMEERVADMDSVTLLDSGWAYWDAPLGASSYELRVYRDGSLAGTTDIRLSDTECDLSGKMNCAGTYTVRVRAVNGINTANKSEWVESAPVAISSARADEIRNGIAFERPLNGDWERCDGRWLYRYEDGSVHEPGWFLSGDKWYWFDESGLTVTGWQTIDGLEYYFDDVTGALLTDTLTPDGYRVNSNGNKKTD